MNVVTHNLVKALRDAIAEAHGTFIFDWPSGNCEYCSLVARADAWLLADGSTDYVPEDGHVSEEGLNELVPCMHLGR